MPSVTLLSPAKINLVLAVTGVRKDGFHDLVSLVAPLRFGDQITVGLVPETGDLLTCDYPGVPTDGRNLALKAVAAFRAKAPFAQGVRIHIDKHIPIGAGLGGGSSNASIVLDALNRLLDKPLSDVELMTISAGIGSDCPLFLARQPVIMRGRGEMLSGLSVESSNALSGQRLIVFKPTFSIETGWAYGRMKAHGGWYCPKEEAEAMIATWQGGPKSGKAKLYNNMEMPAFEKYQALPVVLQLIRERHQARCLMSGSGSSCFVWLDPDTDAGPIVSTIKECLGEQCFWVETAIV